MKVNELINYINDNNFYNLNLVYEKIKGQVNQVAKGMHLDRHRWYSTATDVYECEDGYVGIYGVYQIFSEQMEYEDADVKCYAEEYVAVPRITYISKYEVN